MSDAEWAFFEPLAIETGPRRERRPQDHRRVLDRVFSITQTGSAWRDLHGHFDAWNSVYHQFRRWMEARLWDLMLEAPNETSASHGSIQMIGSTIIRAHQHAVGALKRELRIKVLAARETASRPRSISAAPLEATLSRFCLSSDQVSDMKGYAPVMDQPGPAPRVLLADKGYGADFIRRDLETRGVAAVIPAKRNRKV